MTNRSIVKALIAGAAGLVLERGGTLSHGAIVARDKINATASQIRKEIQHAEQTVYSDDRPIRRNPGPLWNEGFRGRRFC